ncbi:MAG: WYL domain-containing protein [Betaproteobacteria bacterium]|nr:WYL domain-containing protein [Betaproteobacteria bacterium]
MSKTDRVLKMIALLKERGKLTKKQLLAKFEVAEPTFKRDISFLRDEYGAEIRYDPTEKVYRLISEGTAGAANDPKTKHEVPGLWFSQDEILALLSLSHLLEGLGTQSVLGGALDPIRKRFEKLVDANEAFSQIARRFRLLSMAARRMPAEHFTKVVDATLKRRRLKIVYKGRSRGDTTERVISPQRVVHYRDNWYVDAYCHLRERISTFSMDAIVEARMSKAAALEIDDADLDEVLASGYGIFSGKPTAIAVLRFSETISRWVSAEVWHPQQKGEWVGKRWQVGFPYSDSRELVMDVMRYGPDVEVVSPKNLADEVRTRHRQAASL